MSQFVVADIRIESLEDLKEVLDELGFAGKYEVHEKPVALVGYMGDERRQDANVIVRRKNLQSSSNDMGFRWNDKKGSYDMVVSDYDTKIGHAIKQAHALVRLRKWAVNNRRKLSVDSGSLPQIRGGHCQTQEIKLTIS